MKPHYIVAILAISTIIFSDSAMAQNMLMREYIAVANAIEREYAEAAKVIENEYKAIRSNCRPFTENTKNICILMANGREKVAKAELDARYKPSQEADYKVSITRGDADYAVARLKCDDQISKLKKVCIRKAQAALARSISEARTQLQTSEATESYNATIINAHIATNEENEEIRHAAAAYKRE